MAQEDWRELLKNTDLEQSLLCFLSYLTWIVGEDFFFRKGNNGNYWEKDYALFPKLFR